MRNGAVVFFLGLFAIISITAAAPSCTFRSSCNGDETCIFSVYQENDTHVGACGYYATQACCNETTSVTVRSGSCNADENIIISKYQGNDSHVGSRDYYNTKICGKFASNPAIGNIRTSSCLSGEACVASVYQGNDSHVGNCNYYDSKICLRELFGVTITVNLNDSTPMWNGGLRASGTATRADGSFVDSSSGGLNVFVNGTLYCTNETDSSGNYRCDFSAPSSLGNYLANVTLLDPLTSVTWSNTSSFVVTASTGQSSQSSSSTQDVSCYDEPRIVQNPDGSLTVANVRVCIWQ